MSIHILPFVHTEPRHGLLANPLQALANWHLAWKEHRRRRADMALLMSMDQHLLEDIGFKPGQPRSSAGLMQLHPAVLATCLQPRSK